MQALSGNRGQTAVRVAQHQQRVGPDGGHQLIGAGNDVAAGLAEVLTHHVHIHIGAAQVKVRPKDIVQRLVIVLPGVRHDAVKIVPAPLDGRRQTDNLRARSDDDQQLDTAVVLERDVAEICHGMLPPLFLFLLYIDPLKGCLLVVLCSVIPLTDILCSR